MPRRSPTGVDDARGALDLGDDVAVAARNLVKTFPVDSSLLSRSGGAVSAVADVSFDIVRGTTLGLVGESGCGKSTTARCVLRLIEPDSGEVYLRRQLDDGTGETIEVMSADRRTLRELRREMQLVFQDPFASLNPRMTVRAAIAEPLKVHTDLSREERDARVRELLEVVGLPARHAKRYPHEFSGGQRQRIGIARALALHPSFVVSDEPVSALDVSIQAQVLNLLRNLQDELGLTYLFIAHDLAVIRQICDRIAVMYMGKIVEVADADDLYDAPMHPYTHALLSAVPVPDPARQRARQRIRLTGEVPSAADPPPGCRFHPRCPIGKDEEICRTVEPPLEEKASGHEVACHFPQSGAGVT